MKGWFDMPRKAKSHSSLAAVDAGGGGRGEERGRHDRRASAARRFARTARGAPRRRGRDGALTPSGQPLHLQEHDALVPRGEAGHEGLVKLQLVGHGVGRRLPLAVAAAEVEGVGEAPGRQLELVNATGHGTHDLG